MSTTNINRQGEADILSIMRDLESRQPCPKPCKEKKASPDGVNPSKLLESLHKKRDLINLIDGYADTADMGEMKTKLNEAIADLEDILKTAV